MKLPCNRFLKAIEQGQKQIGLWSSLSSGFAADIIAPSGYDWVCIDMEHSPNTLQTVMAQLRAYEGSDTTPLVRVAWNDPVLVKSLLDSGAPGLIFPMIQNAEEARKAVASTLYPPRGIRGVTGTSRANKFGRVKNYFEAVKTETAVILQLETITALRNAEEIAAVEGVDAVFFGPADIAADMDMLGQPMDEAIWNEIFPVATKLSEKNIPLGTLVLNSEFAAQLLNGDFTFVACGSDTSILARGTDTLLATVRNAVK